MNYWLMKSEPDVFSIHDLQSASKQTTPWEGVRNYQARNFMKDQMRIGDKVLFYHSSCEVPGVAGLAQVSSKPKPDPTCWDPKSPYFDPKSSQEQPRWWMVDVKWLKTFAQPVTLQWIREHPDLQEMLLIRKGQRLSIQPVTPKEYQIIATAGSK
jgi:predicted RNA-binding protein with PUA-like domain